MHSLAFAGLGKAPLHAVVTVTIQAGESNKAGGGDKEETTRSRRQVAEGQTDQTNEAVTSEEEDEDLEKGEAGTNEGEKKKCVNVVRLSLCLSVYLCLSQCLTVYLCLSV